MRGAPCRGSGSDESNRPCIRLERPFQIRRPMLSPQERTAISTTLESGTGEAARIHRHIPQGIVRQLAANSPKARLQSSKIHEAHRVCSTAWLHCPRRWTKPSRRPGWIEKEPPLREPGTTSLFRNGLSSCAISRGVGLGCRSTASLHWWRDK